MLIRWVLLLLSPFSSLQPKGLRKTPPVFQLLQSVSLVLWSSFWLPEDFCHQPCHCQPAEQLEVGNNQRAQLVLRVSNNISYPGPKDAAYLPVEWLQLVYGALSFPAKGVTYNHLSFFIYTQSCDPSGWLVLVKHQERTWSPLLSAWPWYCRASYIWVQVPFIQGHLGRKGRHGGIVLSPWAGTCFHSPSAFRSLASTCWEGQGLSDLC